MNGLIRNVWENWYYPECFALKNEIRERPLLSMSKTFCLNKKDLLQLEKDQMEKKAKLFEASVNLFRHLENENFFSCIWNWGQAPYYFILCKQAFKIFKVEDMNISRRNSSLLWKYVFFECKGLHLSHKKTFEWTMSKCRSTWMLYCSIRYIVPEWYA